MVDLRYSDEGAVTSRVRRRSVNHMPFMPYGFVPAFGLIVLLWIAMGPFARYAVEQTALRSAEHALANNGADWAHPVVSGQWIWLEGEPPNSMQAEQAIAMVRTAETSTWLGSAAPITRVFGRFGTPELEGAGIRKPEWTFRLADGVLNLEGNVPDETTRSSFVAAAEGFIAPPRIISVIDTLTVTHVATDPEYSEVAMSGIKAIGSCDRGVATYLSDEFSLRCELPESGVAAIQKLIAQPLAVGRLGNVDILPNEAVATCDASLATLLQDAHIEFAPSSAAIDASSSPLLQAVADAAEACPGTLRIEGHTDIMGSANANELLGDARAEAVRDALIARGIPAERLLAEGFGARKPIDDNQTAEGRAHNRRIEIRVVRASD